MTFTESVSTCLSKYARFSGRASRPEYWWFALFYVLAILVFSLIDAALFGVDPVTDEPNGFLALLVQLALLLPIFSAAWRRLQDSGRPGWYVLLPMVVSILTMIFLFMGVLSFGALENAGADPDALQGPAAVLGVTGLFAASVVQIVLFVLMIWWLTRPSDPTANAYGPPPSA